MRLLLCEDEVLLSNALVAILKHSNYSVDAVYDGVQALEYLAATSYDAVILDIMMPKMDGITVLKTVRKAGNAVPIIMLTAKSEVDDKVLGLDLGANDYLTKPFDTKELLARIRVLTRSNSETISSVIEYGNLALNRATFELKSPTAQVKLSNKEFQMIELLMLNPNHVLSTEKFMEKIWGFDSDSEINVVWVYLSYLRKKLLALDASVQIKATRNIGYSLEEREQ